MSTRKNKEDKKLRVITLRITESEFNKLQNLEKITGWSRSKIVRFALEDLETYWGEIMAEWIKIERGESIDITPLFDPVSDKISRYFRPENPVSIQKYQGEKKGYVFVEYERTRFVNIDGELEEDTEILRTGSPHNITNLTKANKWFSEWYNKEIKRYPNTVLRINRVTLVNPTAWGEKINDVN